MEIHGKCDERFAALREEFERNFTERGDVGASFAAEFADALAKRAAEIRNTRSSEQQREDEQDRPTAH